jgi:hypothetical protein
VDSVTGVIFVITVISGTTGQLRRGAVVQLFSCSICHVVHRGPMVSADKFSDFGPSSFLDYRSTRCPHTERAFCESGGDSLAGV